MNKVKTKDSKRFSGRKREFKQFFRPKTGVLQKKKVITEIVRDFPAEIGNSSSFSVRKQVVSKKKVITEIVRDFSAEIRNSSGFYSRKQVVSKKTKRSSSQKCYEIRCQSTKITEIPVADTSLGLDLLSSSPEPVNFFRAHSSLGGAQFLFGGAQAVIWGGTAPVRPPVAPGLKGCSWPWPRIFLCPWPWPRALCPRLHCC